MTIRIGAQGWLPDPSGARQFAQRLRATSSTQAQLARHAATLASTTRDVASLHNIPASTNTTAPTEALNYRALARCLDQPQLASLDQGDAGTCVGHATALAAETALAVAVEKHAPWQWQHRVSRDGMYALGRTLAGQLGNWDGSSGWAAVLSVHRAGLLWQRDYGPIDGQPCDLSDYSIPRARQWARQGVPQPLVTAAREFPMLQVVHVQTIAELTTVLLAGGAVNLCSSIGFQGRRDADGFIRRRGTWNHSMACTSLRGRALTGREGFLIHQSWGDDWTTGPSWPDDQPRGSFWATPHDVALMLAQGDCFGYLAPTGPRRDIHFEEMF